MRILCATDRLSKSEAAIERASALAQQLKCHVTLLHVVAPGQSEQVLEQSLQVAQAHLESRAQSPQWRGRLPTLDVRTGNPAQLILETIRNSRARLLILGPHRKRALQDVLEGTIAEKALAARLCPVLIAQDGRCLPYRHVLLALDSSEASATAVRAAESLMLAPDMVAQIVHSHEPPYHGMLHYAGAGIESRVEYAESWKREAARAMRDMLMRESAHPARYDIRIEQHAPANGILRTVERLEPDLLIMGTRGGGRLHKAFLGSVANRVLHEVACDTLIVPEGSVRKSRGRPAAARWPRAITNTRDSDQDRTGEII